MYRPLQWPSGGGGASRVCAFGGGLLGRGHVLLGGVLLGGVLLGVGGCASEGGVLPGRGGVCVLPGGGGCGSGGALGVCLGEGVWFHGGASEGCVLRGVMGWCLPGGRGVSQHALGRQPPCEQNY